MCVCVCVFWGEMLCPSECWACVFSCFWFAGILVIVGVSSHLRLIVRSYSDCSVDEDGGQGTGDGGDVTTLAGLATCSLVLLFILFSYSSDLEPTVHWHARFHYWLTLILTTDCLNTLIMLFLCYLLVRVGSRLLQFGASCNCVCTCFFFGKML